MQACIDIVFPYVHERKQFNRSIGEFQMIQVNNTLLNFTKKKKTGFISKSNSTYKLLTFFNATYRTESLFFYVINSLN